MKVICMLTTLVLLVALAGCSAGETGLSYEVFRQKVESLQAEGSGPYMVHRPLAKYKELLGQPEKEQDVEGQYILYYRVREGRAQVILEGGPQVGYQVESINLW